MVILVDEYDKPVIDNLDRPELQDKMRETLRGFYGVMKSKDAFIRFGFLTGVTKIGKMSVFSDLNNPKDISMDARYTDTTKISKNSSSTKNTRNSSSDSKNSQKDTQQTTKTTQASWDIWLGAGIIIGIGATTAIIWIWRKRKKPKN